MNKKLLSISLLSLFTIGVSSCSIGVIDQVVDTTNAITTTNISDFPSHDHDFIHHEKQEPTCTEIGNREYWECSTCSSWFWNPDGQSEILDKDTVKLLPLGHDIEHHTAIDVTCTTNGVGEYWCCTRCNTYFSDAKCNNEITDKSSLITEATGHKLVHHPKVEATCTEDGNREYWSCETCSDWFWLPDGQLTILDKTTVVLEATGHKVSSTWSKDNTHHWHDCSQCDELLDKAEHTWDNGVITTDPTCLDIGIKTYTCTVCGQTKTEEVAALGHDPSSTWSKDETHHWYDCSQCTDKLDKAEHAWNNGVVTKEPTLEESGIKLFTCTVCGQTKEEVIDKTEITYLLSNDSTYYIVAGVKTSATKLDLVIPEEHNGLPVKEIGSKAFERMENLVSVSIPNSVTSIGDSAFASCTSLTSITIPDNVTSIECLTFYNCFSLTSIIIPDSVTSIEEQAFYWCTSLTTVTIGNGVTSIGYCAFDGCASLSSVTIGNGVISIGWDAFKGCTSLTSVTIGKEVKSIERGAFTNCSSLTSVTFENTEGWSTEDGTQLNLSDPATNAILLTKTYSSNYWSRS